MPSRFEEFERFSETLSAFENAEYPPEHWKDIIEVIEQENKRFAREIAAIMPTREDFEMRIDL